MCLNIQTGWMMENKKDIFDRIMSLKMFRPVFPLYKKYKEQLLYLLFGGLTTFLNIMVFAVFTEIFILDKLLANLAAWIIAVQFAFVTNRIWVFRPERNNNAGIQMKLFYLGRLTTLAAEEIILLVFVKILGLPALMVKVASQLIVIVLNYLISIKMVFR